MQDVIFAIDQRNWQAVAVFEQWVRDNGGKLLIGCYTHLDYQKVKERSYLVSEEAFETVKRMGIVADQESFLYVTRCNKQYATLVYASGDVVPLGSMKAVSEEVALRESAWTYDPLYGRYFICVGGNPDNESPEARKQRELWDAVEEALRCYNESVLGMERIKAMTELQRVLDEQKPKWIN